MPNQEYQTNRTSRPQTSTLINEIKQAIADASPFGSVEIYIQNGQVTQITTRHIRKTRDNHYTSINKT